MILASFLFMRRMAEVSSVRLIEEVHPHRDLRMPRDTVLYEVNGPLFFGAVDSAMDAFKVVGPRMKALILGLEAVPAIDVTGLVALESALSRLHQQGVLTLVAGARPQPLAALQRAGIREEPRRLRYCASIEEAVRIASEHVAGA